MKIIYYGLSHSPDFNPSEHLQKTDWLLLYHEPDQDKIFSEGE